MTPVISGVPAAPAPGGTPEGGATIPPKGSGGTSTPPVTTTSAPPTTDTAAPPPPAETNVTVINTNVTNNTNNNVVVNDITNVVQQNITKNDIVNQTVNNVQVKQLVIQNIVTGQRWEIPNLPVGRPIDLGRNFCQGRGGVFAISGQLSLPGVSASGGIFIADNNCGYVPVPRSEHDLVYYNQGRYSKPVRQYTYIKDCGCMYSEGAFSWGRWVHKPQYTYPVWESTSHSYDIVQGPRYAGPPKGVKFGDGGVVDEVASFWNSAAFRYGVPIGTTVVTMIVVGVGLTLRSRRGAHS